jgi:GNAT superfamily N-acetyltransferase
VLKAFDEQVRRQAVPDTPEELVELDERVLRRVPPPGGWTGITWSHLDDSSADAVIDAQIARFGSRKWEWKHYSWDQPSDLPQRLLAHGFRAEPPEALLLAQLDTLALDDTPPAGIEIRAVRDEHDLAELIAVQDAVFGGEHSEIARALLATLTRAPALAGAFVAHAGEHAVAAGRVEVYADSEFASLWGGATLPSWRKRGIFRALVARRAAFARERGAHYLQVDALPTSQPILERLGFPRVATTTPYIHAGGSVRVRRSPVADDAPLR